MKTNRETSQQRNTRLDREYINRRTGQTRGGTWQDNAYLYAKGKRRQTVTQGVSIVWDR